MNLWRNFGYNLSEVHMQTNCYYFKTGTTLNWLIFGACDSFVPDTQISTAVVTQSKLFDHKNYGGLYSFPLFRHGTSCKMISYEKRMWISEEEHRVRNDTVKAYFSLFHVFTFIDTKMKMELK